MTRGPLPASGASWSGMRDAAADRLAFELAARLQNEIEGLAWITSTQRVTSAERRDFDVHGWAGGTLVTFRFRAGRLREWSTTWCSEPEATIRLESSPEAWIPFAHRSARLAAALAGTDHDEVAEKRPRSVREDRRG